MSSALAAKLAAVASITVKAPQGFPAGTTLNAYVDPGGDIQAQGVPAASAVIAADSTVTLNGLTAGIPYQVGATIGGRWRSFLVEIPVPPPSVPALQQSVLDEQTARITAVSAEQASRQGADAVLAPVSSLRSVDARGREPVHKALIRNDFTNPRAVGLTNWANLTTGSPTGVTFTDVDDAEFILGADYAATGHCAKITATNLPAGGTLVIQPGRPAAGVSPTAVVAGQMVFGRVKVKVPTCPTDSTVVMQIRFTDIADVNPYVRTLHTKQVVNSGDIFNLEGHIVVPAGVVRAHLFVYITSANAGAVDMRIGNAQIVVEPEGDVPECVDGYRAGGVWDGTADASTSYGFVWPAVHDPVTFRGGFNYFHAFHNEVPIDPDRLCDVMVEMGLTHLRLSVGTGAKGVDGVWPSNTGTPDWSKSVIWPIMQALQKRGLKYLPLIAVPTLWMTTDGSFYPSRLNPTYQSQFLQLHTSLLDQAPKGLIDAVEVWNEPNLVGTDPGLTPAVYTAVLSSLYDAIKASHPEVKVVAGSLARYQSDDASGTSVLTYLRGMYAAGAKTKMDAISFHPYTDDLSTKDSELTGQFHSGFDQMLRQVDQVKHENADDAKPLWVTEYGWDLNNGGNERQQMQTMALWRGRLARNPRVEAAFFDTLLSDFEDTVANRGYSMMEPGTVRRRVSFRAFSRDGIAPGERWRYLTLQNGWTVTTGGAGFPARAKYRKDVDIVELRFLITKTTGLVTDVIGTLPEGYLPFETVVRPCFYYNGSTFGVGMVQITGRNAASGAGQVKWATGGSIAAGNVNYIELSFVADG